MLRLPEASVVAGPVRRTFQGGRVARIPCPSPYRKLIPGYPACQPLGRTFRPVVSPRSDEGTVRGVTSRRCAKMYFAGSGRPYGVSAAAVVPSESLWPEDWSHHVLGRDVGL